MCATGWVLGVAAVRWPHARPTQMSEAVPQADRTVEEQARIEAEDRNASGRSATPNP